MYTLGQDVPHHEEGLGSAAGGVSGFRSSCAMFFCCDSPVKTQLDVTTSLEEVRGLFLDANPFTLAQRSIFVFVAIWKI